MNATLFIPDISGFTQFVKSTEKAHSKHIISELLALIIQKGQGVFSLAEVEGDAVFFFHQGDTYPTEKVNAVVRSIYEAFHNHLSNYEHKRICDCGACRTANDLKLKFIVHAGDIELISVADKDKPFGESVITIHRLLKNDVPHQEYVLYTCSFLKNNPAETSGSGIMQDRDLGHVEYRYTSLAGWWKPPSHEQRLQKDADVDLVVTRKRKINLSTNDLHEMLVNLKYRHYWNKGVDEIIYDPEEINQVGSSHRCIVNGRDLHFDTVRPENESDLLSYGEILKNPKPFRFFEADYFLKEIGDNQTLLTLVLRVNFVNFFHKLLSPVFRALMSRRASSILLQIDRAIPDFLASQDIK